MSSSTKLQKNLSRACSLLQKELLFALLIIKVYSWVNHFKHIVQICFVCHKMFFQERPIMQSDYFCAFLLAQVLKSFNERLNLLHIDMILRAKTL